MGPSLIVESPSILAKKIFFARGGLGPLAPLSTTVHEAMFTADELN